MLSKLLFFWVIDIIVFTCLFDHNFKKNERLGKIGIFLCCQLHNFILGFHANLIWLMSIGCFLFIDLNFPFLYEFLSGIFSDFYVPAAILLLLIIILLLVPINYFSNRKIKVNYFIYIITTIIVFVLGIFTFFISSKYLDYI